MIGYVMQFGLRFARFARREVGQNLIETALIVAVVSIVLVAGFMATNIDAAMTDVADQIICNVQGGTWVPGEDGAAGAGDCGPTP